jgi:hypothetical protein
MHTVDANADTPISDRTGRWGLLAGAAAGVLWLVSLAVLESAGNPAGPASGDEVARFYLENRPAILAASTLHVLGGFFFLLFVAALWPALREPVAPSWIRAAVLVSGTAAGALMLALMGGHSTGATTDEVLLTPEVAVAFWRIAHVFFVAAELAMAAFVAALSIAALLGALPRWVAWSGVVLAILLVVTPVGWLALLFLLPPWLIALSLVLFRRGI